MVRRVMDNVPYTVSEAEFTRLRTQHASVINSVQEESGDMNDEDDGQSSINLRVSTALRIQGDNNAVLLSITPIDHARAVAQAVISAIRQCGDVNGGIPVIDEEGRPRPLHIAVDSGVKVEGSGNVLGNEKHIMRFLSGGGAGGGWKRKRDNGDDGEKRDGHGRRRLTRSLSV